MPRFKIGHKKRVNTGFSVDPDVLTQAKETAGRIPLSSIIESLLMLYVKNPKMIEE